MNQEPAPPRAVLSAFGLSGAAVPLAGGQETTWRSGDTVLKPLDLAPDELTWQAELFGSIAFEEIPDRLFRLDKPLRPDDEDPYLPVVDLACRVAS